jgi:hypothetical protein
MHVEIHIKGNHQELQVRAFESFEPDLYYPSGRLLHLGRAQNFASKIVHAVKLAGSASLHDMRHKYKHCILHVDICNRFFVLHIKVLKTVTCNL